jgi:hypothetical protein
LAEHPATAKLVEAATAALASPRPRYVANGIRGRQNFKLNAACRVVNQLLSENGYCYQVGSSLDSNDYHDVDVRYIMSDDDWEKMFPGTDPRKPRVNGLWSLLCFMISEWLSNESGLNVDFQIQQRTRANADFRGLRSALGDVEFYPGGG